jgi:hypothetical protein
MKRCSIVFFSPQKAHFVHPFHLCLVKLSLVSKTLLLRNHINILILRETLTSHRYFLKKSVWSFIRSSYIDFTVNKPLVVKIYTKRSVSSFKLTIINFWHNYNHKVHLWPTNNRLKLIFRSVRANRWATVTFLGCRILTILTIKFGSVVRTCTSSVAPCASSREQLGRGPTKLCETFFFFAPLPSSSPLSGRGGGWIGLAGAWWPHLDWVPDWVPDHDSPTRRAGRPSPSHAPRADGSLMEGTEITRELWMWLHERWSKEG